MTQSFNLQNNTELEKKINGITTYGALLLPFDKKKATQQAQTQTDPKEKTEQQGKILSALKIDNQTNVLQDEIRKATDPNEKEELQQKLNNWTNFKSEISKNKNVKILAEYMQDKRNLDKLGSAFGVIGSKFSGIAVTQALIDGKVTSKEARDYFFMGFAPAIGVQGSLMGYSGLSQMKEALSDGSIDVGAFVSGFRTVLKGATDLKDMLTKKDVQANSDIIEIDLTISHSENYQSETPDRRVQSGQSLNEYVHNMPDTFDVQCALQDGKRYSKSEFRAILQYLRNRKETVQLVLGDEVFENLILTSFNPTNDCTKSGMDYNLSFKKITRSDVKTNTEVNIQTMPEQLVSDVSETNNSSSLPSIAPPDLDKEGQNLTETVTKYLTKGKTTFLRIFDAGKKTLGEISQDIKGDKK